MFRALVARIAKLFPPEFVAKRILPWTTSVLAAFVASWAIWEYSNDVAINRVRATLELHDSFRQSLTGHKLLKPAPGGTSLGIEIRRVRCNVIQASIQAGKLSNSKISGYDCDNLIGDQAKHVSKILLDTESRAKVREVLMPIRLQAFSLDQLEASGRYLLFDAVRVCTVNNNCDPETAVALFAKDITAFLNVVCIYVEEGSYGGREETITLAQFLLNNNVDKNIFWSEDTGRENLFHCDYLRALK